MPLLSTRAVQVALAKTERAPNSLNVAGRIDMSKSNAWTGDLKVTSDGLDVTPYYDLFARKEQKATPAKDTAPVLQLEPKPETEPEPMKLPFTQFAGQHVGRLGHIHWSEQDTRTCRGRIRLDWCHRRSSAYIRSKGKTQCTGQIIVAAYWRRRLSVLAVVSRLNSLARGPARRRARRTIRHLQCGPLPQAGADAGAPDGYR